LKNNSIEIKRNKRSDFVIYVNDKPKIALECNFYSSTGSKPIEVANAYIDLNSKCNDVGIILVWVTDGPAWTQMIQTIKDTFMEIDFAMNYQILDEKFDLII